jgi:hypothetical protein
MGSKLYLTQMKARNMRELDPSEAKIIAGGVNQGLPSSCSVRSMLTSAGFGALAGIPGFAGGPILGFSGMLWGASVGGMYQFANCANDLRRH